MPDIGAGRSAQPAMRLRLKRQQGKHMVDIGAHPARPARAPHPDRRADIVDHGQPRQRAAHLAGDAMREVRAVDQHESIRPRRDRRFRRFVDAGEQGRQTPHHGQQAIDRDVIQREQGRQALAAHGLAAHPGKFDRIRRLQAQRAHQLEPELGAGMLPGDEKQLHGAGSRDSRGRHMARSPPLRRKSRISCTSGWSANSAATSSTRSFSVPSCANSSR